MHQRISGAYEQISRIYDQLQDKICFVTGSSVGAIDMIIQDQSEQSTQWGEFLIKTTIAGLMPLLLKKLFDAIANRISKK